MTFLEISANVMTAVCIILAGRNNVHTWWTGIVACILFGFLFFDSKLYADVSLQVFFVVTGIIGWYNWADSNRAFANKEHIKSIQMYTLLKYLSIALATALAYGAILHHYTDAYAPWIDSLVLTFSVVAQLLLMRRYRETWMIWLFVNSLSVPMFYSRELYLTSALYGVFWVNAIISHMHWNKLYAEQKASV